MNSFVANYLIRLRVNTHVTVSLVSRLPVPVVRPNEAAYDRLAALSKRLMETFEPVEGMDEYAELQALAATLYRCTSEEFRHVLSTFPLVSAEARANALSRFTDVC
jgi:hypothetical protein